MNVAECCLGVHAADRSTSRGGRSESPGCGRSRLHRCRPGAVPASGRARGRRARPRPVRGMRPRPRARSQPVRRPAGHARRRARPAGRLRRGGLPGRAVQRPARRPQPGGHLLGEPGRHAAPGPGGQAGRRASVSCSPRRAACTARPGSAAVAEDAELFPVTPYGETKVDWPSASCPSWPTTTSARPTCATPPPTAPRPGSASTSW